MGGSGSRSGSYSGGSGSPGSGTGGTQGGLPCPEVATAFLTDVANAPGAGNASIGASAELAPDDTVVRVEVNGQTIGWLPLDISQRLIPCIENGISYSCTIISVTTGSPPQIEVSLQRQ